MSRILKVIEINNTEDLEVDIYDDYITLYKSTSCSESSIVLNIDDFSKVSNLVEIYKGIKND